jgi:multidrug efflux pump subunit AcrA (membrane-fusion protein)
VPPLFRLLERARPNPAAFLVRRTWRNATRNGRRAIVVGAILLAVLLAWPFHYTIRTDCRLVPKVKRTVAAPFDGQLGRSRVQPGDNVAAGDALVVMENRELKLKQAELTASRDQALKKRDRAMNSREGADFSAAQVAAFEAEGIIQELALVDRKLAMLEVKAPIAGMVVSGDLRRAEGQPTRQGQVLFEIAPLSDMIVELDVPDREVSRVRTGMPVSFRVEAFGGWSGGSRIERLHPQSEQRDGANVFIAEAPVAKGAPELRPGMRGRASIEADRRPLIWIIGHRFVDWVETTLLW